MNEDGAWQQGDAYERYVGRWSRMVAREFLGWLDCPRDLHWLDAGCGTGALGAAIVESCAPAAVIGIDPSEGFLAAARARIGDPRARFKQGDGQALRLPDAALDVAVSGLVLNFVPDPAAMICELRRVVRPGGTVAVYVWDYAGEMQLMRHFWDAAVALDSGAKQLDEGVRFPICRPDPLANLLTAAGLEAVTTTAIDVPTVFEDFEDYWTPFLGGQGPAPGYCVSLPERQRTALRERLRASLPVGPDGRIALIARAFAARGEVPPGVSRAAAAGVDRR
jgi:SAM-dependent methyltransferase